MLKLLVSYIMNLQNAKFYRCQIKLVNSSHPHHRQLSQKVPKSKGLQVKKAPVKR